jgi:sugar lactone lactonase YvrE
MKLNTKNLITTLLLLLFVSNAFGQDTEIYVSDAGNFSSPPWQILKFDGNGDNPQVFINENLGWPQDIVFLDDANTVLISNLSTNQITRYDSATGTYIDTFAQVPGGPTRMKIGNDGLLYVLQWNGNGRVLRYQLNGTYVGEFTSIGVPQSIGMDWDAEGNLYVSSYTSDHVRKFDGGGNDLGLFISSNLVGPTNITFDSNGDLLVSDYDFGRVKRFDSAGNYLSDFISGLSKVEGIDMFANGNILVGNGGQHSVRMYDSDGQFIENFITSGSGGLITPNAIVIRNDNTGNPFQINAGLNDAWYNPATDGQGFSITVFPDKKLIFLSWFTYDTAHPSEDTPSNLGDASHRWLTALGSYETNQSVMDVSVTSGGLFDTSTDITRKEDGTVTVTFDGCNSGILEYDIPSINRQGTIPITRIAGDNIALCELLKDVDD